MVVVFSVCLAAGEVVGQSPLESSDITGQEDPLLLHTVIATMPAVQAHREGKTLSFYSPYITLPSGFY